MEETTTPAATQDPGVDPTTQPEEQPAEAVTPTSEPTPTDTPSEEPAAADNPEDDDLSDYWSKKGIDISTPEGQKAAAKSYREAEKAMHTKSQQASELQKQMAAQPLEASSQDPMVQTALERAARAETTVMVAQWKAERGITHEQDVAIGQYIADNPEKGYLLKNGYLSLDDVYSMSGVGKVDTETIEAKGGQKALEKLANKQRAAAVTGQATAPTAPAEHDPILAALRGE